MKPGDRVEYVGRSNHPSDPQSGALGVVTWAGDIVRIDQEPLRGWVKVKWDNPPLPFDPEYRGDQVRLVG
jgi:hypothetical protein